MKIVYFEDNKWWNGNIFITSSYVTLSRYSQVKSIDDVEDIDNYVNVKKYVKKHPFEKNVLDYMKRNDIKDMYIKENVIDTQICLKCAKECKNPTVIACNYFVQKKKK